jgi:tetratricopeptide (TPR) repeat protein
MEPQRHPRVAPHARIAIGALALALLAGVAWEWSVRLRVRERPSAAPAAESVPAEERRLREAVARQPGASSHRALARYYEGEGQVAAAVWEYGEARAADPADEASALALAVSLGALGLHDLTVDRLRARLRAPSPPSDARRALAEFCLATGRVEEALSAVTPEAALADAPTAITRGRALLALERPGSAEAAFRAAIRLQPEGAPGYLWLGAALARAGRADEARVAWRKAASLAPESPESLWRMARLEAARIGSSGTAEAVAALEEALRRAPSYGPALIEKGRLLLVQGRSQEALAAFEDAVRAASGEPDAYAGQAAALRALGRREEALRFAGLAEALAERPARAIPHLEAYAAARPDDPARVQLLAQAHIQMRRNERAAAVVADALKRMPGETALQETVATLYLMTLSLKEARATCEAWLRREPEAARPRWLLGRAASASQRPEEARRWFEEARARAPEEPVYVAALGDALARHGPAENRAAALALLREAVARAPDVAEYRLRLAGALGAAGEWEAARDAYLAALSRDPSLAAAYPGLVQAAQRLGRHEQVAFWARANRLIQERNREEERLRRRIGADPTDAAAYLELAHVFLHRGSTRVALAQAEEAARLRPGWSAARALLSRLTALRDAL